jgi:protein-arginine kinase activator protein McsA
MSDKELKDELDKAVAAEDYDLAVQIRAEKLRRNI